MNLILKLNKNIEISRILCLIKHLDPLFFEFLIDNIRHSGVKLRLNNKLSGKIYKKNISSFLTYFNIFSTEELDLQLKNKVIDIKTKKNLVYLLTKKRILSKNLNKELKGRLQILLKINPTHTNHTKVIVSQVPNPIEIVKIFRLL